MIIQWKPPLESGNYGPKVRTIRLIFAARVLHFAQPKHMYSNQAVSIHHAFLASTLFPEVQRPITYSRTRSGWIPTATPGPAETAQKRARNAEEAEEPASILMDLSDSFASLLIANHVSVKQVRTQTCPSFLDRHVREVDVNKRGSAMPAECDAPVQYLVMSSFERQPRLPTI